MTKEQRLEIKKAIRTGRLDYIKELFHHHPDSLGIYIIDDSGNVWPAIHYAAQCGQLDMVELFLEKKPDWIDYSDINSTTPVSRAAAHGHVHVVEFLARRGAKLTTAINAVGVYGHLSVLKCLISLGADINARIGFNKYHLIHVACVAGQLEVVRFILTKDPALLNIRDFHDQTPLILAAANGHDSIVAYLLSENAHLNITTKGLFNTYFGKIALSRAMDNQHYDSANLIILKMTANQSKHTITPFVQSAEQALGLMVLDPALISIFQQDPRIVNLCKRVYCDINKPLISSYRVSGRRPSFFTHIDTERGTSAIFKPVRELGTGRYGRVRLFQSADGQAIAVKSFKDQSGAVSIVQWHRFVKEAELSLRAYPDYKFNYISSANCLINGQEIWVSRYVLDFVKGETAWVLIPKITCTYELAQITLQIAEELLRIHNLGVLHGDLNPSNIMIDCSQNKTFIIRFIDFGLSSYMTDPYVRLFDTVLQTWIAPELVSGPQKIVKPHPNQDVYGLGYALNLVLNRNALKQELMRVFPVINRFILESQNIDPMSRPSLESFCEELRDEVYPKLNLYGLCSIM